jgi:signal transduction histidine kinase
VHRAGWVSLACAGVAGLLWLVQVLGDWQTTGLVDGLTTLLPVPIAFACGMTTPRIVGLAACLWLIAIGESAGGFNPFIIVLTIGPWLAATVLRERQQVARRLQEVGRELEAESQMLAEDAVKLERARIARELHDIVAHCVSVMVIQAYAGEKLMATDRTSASEAFDHIAEAADQAQREIGRLVTLLDVGAPTPFGATSLSEALEELTQRARATGLDIRLNLTGHPEEVSATASAVAYRVVQEGVTNALKHAPGAPITIVVDCGAEVAVDVVNGVSQVTSTRLEASGGGHGLPGIRDRVNGMGGTFAAGRQLDGAWRISVCFPAA